MIPPLRTRLDGTVAEYDDHAGTGWLEVAEGEPAVSGGRLQRYFVHCTQIADGSRHLDVGQRVRFHCRPGHLGRWEAAAVERR